MPRNGLRKTNSFFSAFLEAYTNHGSIALIPDEVWLMIIFFVSKYVQENCNALRAKLVPHQGVKTLTVIEQQESATKDKAE